MKVKITGGKGWHISPRSWAMVEFGYYGPHPRVYRAGGVGINDVTVWFLKLI